MKQKVSRNPTLASPSSTTCKYKHIGVGFYKHTPEGCTAGAWRLQACKVNIAGGLWLLSIYILVCQEIFPHFWAEPVFSWREFWNLATVAPKRSSRNFPPNYVISFFHLYLMLHTRIVRFDVMGTVALFRKLFWN